VVIAVHPSSLSEDRLRKFVAVRKLTFPIALDSDDSAGWASRYHIESWPSQVLIGRDGRVIANQLRGDVVGSVRRAVLYESEGGEKQQ
jgi:hypothetical protein